MRRPVLLVLMALVLFVAALTAAAQDAGGTSTYTVKTGDVLDLIAAAFDVDTDCLARINDLANPNRLRSGQVLLVDLSCPPYTGYAFVINPRSSADSPGQGGGAVEARPAFQPGPNDQTYTVRRGDTLDTIGQALNVSVISLQLANDLRNPNKLAIGDVLVIPGDAPPYGQYPPLANPLVAAGARGALELGQGGGGLPTGPGDVVYVVQLRDVLDLIGAAYDRQAACIAEANGLANPNLLYAGQTLIVPSACPPYDGEAFVPSRGQGG